MSYTHGIRNLRISGILISSPYNGGNRLHLLLYDFRQLLKGEFHNFLPLLLSNQQFSVLRSGCTIPYHCILLITLFGFFEMNIRLNHSLQIYYKRFNHMSVGATGFEPATSRPPAVRATKLRHTPVRTIISSSLRFCNRFRYTFFYPFQCRILILLRITSV